MSASPRETSAHPLASTMHAGAASAPAGAALEAELRLAPGTIVADRYRIDGLIARGGMGAVLRATDRRLDRPVALKVILPALAEDLEAVERLRREALSAARVQHPGIVAVLDVGTCPHPDGRGRLCYLVMELVEGESLAAMTARGPLAPELVVEIGLQALDALAAAHDAGLVHRDLKPANVLVSSTRSGIRVRLADFGLVQLTGSVAHSRLTQSGVILGTPLYMAPEQARAEPCDARTDVYALGLVLWTCLTGRLPSNADGFASAIVAVLTEELPARGRVVPECSATARRCDLGGHSKRPARASRLGDRARVAALDDTRSGLCAAHGRRPIGAPRPRADGWLLARALSPRGLRVGGGRERHRRRDAARAPGTRPRRSRHGRARAGGTRPSRRQSIAAGEGAGAHRDRRAHSRCSTCTRARARRRGAARACAWARPRTDPQSHHATHATRHDARGGARARPGGAPGRRRVTRGAHGARVPRDGPLLS
jgi:hypothetical protein